jgi:DNA-binding transcriptional MerR regulator/effector-binding domain-containing protein
MTATLPIGDFSRATHLSVKMLRHYHDIGLLEPADIDGDTGYRRYATEQIVMAQIIRRFRDLDMPLEDIQVVLQAPDVETRNRVIANHLGRLESSLARTHEAVTSLRELLDHPQASVPIDHRHLATTPAAVITDIVDKADALAWCRGAIGELVATLSAQDISPAGPAGGVFDTEIFTEDRGRATIFLPCDPVPQPIGRVSATVIPPAELATIVHPGPHTDIDRTYGVLAAYVTQHELAVDGPLREYFLVGPSDTRDDSLWRTEVGWPIFQTRHTPQLQN